MEILLVPLLLLLGVAFVFTDDEEGEDDSEPNVIVHNDDDNTSVGTQSIDRIFMLGGDDIASGGDGNDEIFLGSGDDATVEIATDGSFDTVGMDGDDLIRGGDGNDIIFDSIGSNTIYGDVGEDVINAVDFAGDDDGSDIIFGGYGADQIYVDDGDIVSGGAGYDSFYIVVSEPGTVEPVIITDISGGPNFDENSDSLTFVNTDGEPYTRGHLWREYPEDSSDIHIYLKGHLVAVLQGAADHRFLPDITNELAPRINGNSRDDVIELGPDTQWAYGSAGDDVITFADTPPDPWRSVRIYGGDGDDEIIGRRFQERIDGGDGNDTLIGGGGGDVIFGGEGDDIFNSVDFSQIDGQPQAAQGDSLVARDYSGQDTYIFDAGDRISNNLSSESSFDTYIQVHREGDVNVARIANFNPELESLTVQTNSPTGVLGFIATDDFIDLAPSVGGAGTYVTIDEIPITFLREVTVDEARAADITLERV